MQAKCITPCYFQGTVWKPGDIFEGPEIDPSVENCFVSLDAPKPVPAPKKEEKK